MPQVPAEAAGIQDGPCLHNGYGRRYSEAALSWAASRIQRRVVIKYFITMNEPGARTFHGLHGARSVPNR
jgi:hypothetical protein